MRTASFDLGLRHLPQLVLAAAIAFAGADLAPAGIVDFENQPLGTKYGGTVGHAPGDFIFQQNNTRVTVEEFYFVPFPAGPIFLEAEIVRPPHFAAVNPSHSMALGNINARFDFSNYPGEVNKATVDYVDFGGNENFSINGLGPFSVNDLPLLPPIPGFAVNVTAAPVATGGIGGTVEIKRIGTAPIKSLMIGGQEFGIDNVEAPFAGDLNGDGLINFADLRPMSTALQNPADYAAIYPNLDRVTRCDTNFDGLCNFGDIDGFVDLISGGPGAGSAIAGAVPEPASLALVSLLALMIGSRWRRRAA